MFSKRLECCKFFLQQVNLRCLSLFQDQDNVQLYLGLTPIGVAIIREGKKVSGFVW